MKKIIAVVLIFSMLSSSNAPAIAQVAKGLSVAAKAGKALKVSVPAVSGARFASGAVPLLRTSVVSAAKVALFGKVPTFATIKQRVALGKMEFVPEVILAHPDNLERASLLRKEFGLASVKGEATAAQLMLASMFWRKEITTEGILLQNVNSLTELSGEKGEKYVEIISDAANLAVFAKEQFDVVALSFLYTISKGTPLEELFATTYSRSLLKLGNYRELEHFFSGATNGKYPALQNGIREYALANQLDVNIPQVDVKLASNELLKTLLASQGNIVRLAADSSAQATTLWMNMAKGVTLQGEQALKENAIVEANLPKMETPLEVEVPEAEALQASATELPVENATQEAVVATPEQESLPVPTTTTVNPTNMGSRFLASLKGLFKKKNSDPTKAEEGALVAEDSLAAKMQRASIYVASFVMGLEVATPVIANFGTSFNISLEDNILVTAATYLPYSLGAFAANWIKQKIGRKNSLNLGLGLMLGSFLAGVFGCGLDGSFLAETDTLMHFYKALACITTASFGGVLVHNSVGPIMTELNAGANDLVRQQRSSMTELSRATGMAASFAFPWLATSVLGQDWSFAFAMPIPFVVAALIGANIAKLPNTKPLSNVAIDPVKKTGFLNKIKNSEYLRLFKEEKGIAPLLTGLFIMNAVETTINNGFMLLLPSLVKDASTQYIAGLMQFAAPFLFGRYLAAKFLKWFPKDNLSIATTLAAGGALVSLLPGIRENVPLLTTALFASETGISTAFTLAYARTAKNPATQDRVTSLIVASALACAVGPVMLTNIAQSVIESGMMSSMDAMYSLMIGVPAVLSLLSAGLFRRTEQLTGTPSKPILKRIMDFIKRSIYHPTQRRQRS